MPRTAFALLATLAVFAAAQQCPYPLRPTQAEHLVEPPLLAQSLSGPLGDTVNINITVPQTVPARSNVSALFENPATHAPTSVVLSVTEEACRFISLSQLPLPSLIRNAQPYIIEAPDHYALRFLIRVHFTEQFTLHGVLYDRPYDASVGFEVILYRTLDVSSAITTLDATLVWGYIQKFSSSTTRSSPRP
eukprot:m51a1_g13246 hypothetical protein (191) ;mRNA; f:1101-1902